MKNRPRLVLVVRSVRRGSSGACGRGAGSKTIVGDRRRRRWVGARRRATEAGPGQAARVAVCGHGRVESNVRIRGGHGERSHRGGRTCGGRGQRAGRGRSVRGGKGRRRGRGRARDEGGPHSAERRRAPEEWTHGGRVRNGPRGDGSRRLELGRARGSTVGAVRRHARCGPKLGGAGAAACAAQRAAAAAAGASNRRLDGQQWLEQRLEGRVEWTVVDGREQGREGQWLEVVEVVVQHEARRRSHARGSQVAEVAPVDWLNAAHVTAAAAAAARQVAAGRRAWLRSVGARAA